MKFSDADALPLCAFSAHCLRLLNDLDAPDDAGPFEQVFSASAKDRRDERLLEELRAHLAGCPTCIATIASARQLRSQQRRMLRSYLLNGESRVPSTAKRILAVLRQELPLQPTQPQAPQKRQRYILPEVFVPLPVPKSNGNGHHSYANGHQSTATSNRWQRNGFILLATAALLFAVVGAFGYFALHIGKQTRRVENKSWSSVIIGVSLLSSLPEAATMANIYNVDTTSGQSEQLATPVQSSEEVQYETVSPDGKDVLYYFSHQGQTVYATLQTVKSRGYVVQVPNSDESNAIWMDNNHILVAHQQSGVDELDIYTGALVQELASPINAHLLFYHSPYLYFQDAEQTMIDRIDVKTGVQQPLTSGTDGLNFSDCVLKPDGSRLYCEARSSELSRSGPELYMVNSDGSGAQALNRRGILLGFGQNYALLFLQLALNNYQIVKLGQAVQQDQVLMKNAIPATALIGSGDAMLAPDGHALIVQDENKNNTSRGVWYDDLSTQTSRELITYAPGFAGHLVGWDQLLVKGARPTPVASVPTTSPATVQMSSTEQMSSTAQTSPAVPVLDPFGGWNGVVLITRSGGTNDTISTYNFLNGDHSLLANPGASIEFDGVASSGMNMLYHVNADGNALYYTLNRLPVQGYFFQLEQDEALNAIWMPDSIHVLIATADEGVVQVDTRTGNSQSFLPSLQVQELKFYRDGYLYFLGGPDRASDALYRANATTGVVQQVTMRSDGDDFWLSPDGQTIYFQNDGPADRSGIYAVSSDGTKGGRIRLNGTPIGYAADNSLVVMREVDRQFEVVRLGETPRQDQVLLSNAAPGARSLCETSYRTGDICVTSSVALAPFGHALVVAAYYPDGSRKVWSDNLMTGNQFVMQSSSSATMLEAPGWDCINVP